MDYNEKPQSYQNDSDNIQYSEMSAPKKSFDLWQLLKIICLTVICLGITATTVLTLVIFSHEYRHIQGLVKDDTLPSKFYLKDMTPNQNQGNRATCWNFATIGALEHSYTTNGRKKGYLADNETVLFSPQAYGISYVNACMKASNKNVCKEYRKGATKNTTNGGDISWLSYLPEMWTQLYPKSICPYQPNSEDEFLCEGLEEEMRKKRNPIRFTVENTETVYETTSAKRLLMKHGHPLPLTFAMGSTEWRVPCSPDPSADPTRYSAFCTGKTAADMSPCPPEITKIDSGDKCITILERPSSIDGELRANQRPKFTGEHSVQVVGWNDEVFPSSVKFRAPAPLSLPGVSTSVGAAAQSNPQHLVSTQGGFIVQNSWDGPSHSMAYWAGDISTWDERKICPNPTSPRNWLSCTQLVSNVTYRTPGLRRNTRRMSNEKTPVDLCANDAPYMTSLMKALSQPYQFECVVRTNDAGYEYTLHQCDTKKRYFFDAAELDENGLISMTFVALPLEANDTYEYYHLRQVTEQEVSNTLTPIKPQLELFQNDPHNCGYHLLPYSFLDVSTQSNSWFAMAYDIKWEDSSYMAKKKSYPSYNYDFLNSSTIRTKKFNFDGPLPLANKNKDL